MALARFDSQSSFCHPRVGGCVRPRSAGATSRGNPTVVLYGRSACHQGRSGIKSALSVPQGPPLAAEASPPSFVADRAREHSKGYDGPSKGFTLTASTLDALPNAESVCSDSDSCWSPGGSEASKPRARDIELDFEDAEMSRGHYVYETSEGSSGEEDAAPPAKDLELDGAAGKSKSKRASCWSSSSSEASESRAGDIELDFEVMDSNLGHYVYETSESSSDDEDDALPEEDLELAGAASNSKQAPFDFRAGTPTEEIGKSVTAIMLQHVPWECTEGDLQHCFQSAGFMQPHISVKVFVQGSSRKFALVRFDSRRLAQEFSCTYQGAFLSCFGIGKPLVLLPVEGVGGQ